MCANCGAMSSKFDAIDKDMKFTGSGTVNNRLVCNVGDTLNVEVTFGEYDLYDDVMIDPATPLPEGLTFSGNTISGKVDAPYNGFIRVIFTDDIEVVHGNTLNLTVLAIAQKDGEVNEEKEEIISIPKKKCNMSIVAASSMISLLTLAGAALLLGKRKRA